MRAVAFIVVYLSSAIVSMSVLVFAPLTNRLVGRPARSDRTVFLGCESAQSETSPFVERTRQAARRRSFRRTPAVRV